MLAAAGILAAVLAAIDTLPYLRDTLRGTTRPQRATWLIWSVLGSVAFAAQLASGATWSLLMVGVQTAVTGATFALSIRHGVGGLGRADIALLGMAGAGLVGWFVLDSAVLATASVVVADSCGVALMLPKTWSDPGSETLTTFVLATCSGALAAVAVGELTLALLLYPVYFTFGNLLIATVIVAGRRRPPPATLAEP